MQSRDESLIGKTLSSVKISGRAEYFFRKASVSADVAIVPISVKYSNAFNSQRLGKRKFREIAKIEFLVFRFQVIV